MATIIECCALQLEHSQARRIIVSYSYFDERCHLRSSSSEPKRHNINAHDMVCARRADIIILREENCCRAQHGAHLMHCIWRDVLTNNSVNLLIPPPAYTLPLYRGASAFAFFHSSVNIRVALLTMWACATVYFDHRAFVASFFYLRCLYGADCARRKPLRALCHKVAPQLPRRRR